MTIVNDDCKSVMSHKEIESILMYKTEYFPCNGHSMQEMKNNAVVDSTVEITLNKDKTNIDECYFFKRGL